MRICSKLLRPLVISPVREDALSVVWFWVLEDRSAMVPGEGDEWPWFWRLVCYTEDRVIICIGFWCAFAPCVIRGLMPSSSKPKFALSNQSLILGIGI